MRTNVYANAEEKFVKTVQVYANASSKLFYDVAAKDEPVKAVDIQDLFVKGMTVLASDATMYKPVCLKNNTVVCVSDAATAVKFTVTA